MEKQKKFLNREIRRLNEQKKTVNVFDSAANDLLYKRHKKELRYASKKVDNSNPVISSSEFFSQSAFKNMRYQIEDRVKKNLRLVHFVNATARSEGKVSCYNPIAMLRNSKLPYRIIEQKFLRSENKKILQTLKTIEPSPIVSKKQLNDDWELNSQPTIVKALKYSVAINTILTPEIDPFLEDPPTYEEYRKSKKVFFIFNFKNHGQIGRVEIMLNCEQNSDIINQFIKTCSKTSTKSYRYCNVYKILQDFFIESGDCTFKNDGSGVESEKFKVFPTSCEKGKHFYPGTVSLLLDETGSIVTNFSITLKAGKISIFEKQQVVIGRVVKGLDVLAALNSFGTRYGLPKKTIFIGNCGVLK